MVASLGSSISVIAVFIFFYFTYDLLVYGCPDLYLSWKNDLLTCFYVQKLFLGNRLSFINKIKRFKFLDSPENWQLGFQDPASSIMEGVIELHHDIMYFLIVIIIFVSWMLIRIIQLFNQDLHAIPANITHNIELEIIWTTIPSIILLMLAIPSFSLLYAIDELASPEITVKVIGNQWFWSYEFSEINGVGEKKLKKYGDLFLQKLKLLQNNNG